MFKVNDIVAWDQAISPIFPRHFSGTVTKIEKSVRLSLRGEYKMTIKTDYGDIHIHSIDDGFKYIQLVN